MVDKLTQTRLRSIKERAASGRKAIQDELQSRPNLMAFGQQPATRAELAKTEGALLTSHDRLLALIEELADALGRERQGRAE